MAIDLKDIKVGDRVYYQSPHSPKNTYEKGIISGVEKSKAHVFVVFHCNEDWDNYKNYSSQLTDLKSLYHGWVPGQHETIKFLEKYGSI